MEQEKIQQKVIFLGTSVDRSAMAVPDAHMTYTRYYYTCWKKGHQSWSYPLFYNAGMGRTDRGKLRGVVVVEEDVEVVPEVGEEQ